MRPTPDKLNPPERVLKGFASAAETMAKVDGVLGEQRVERFAVALSSLSRHVNPEAAHPAVLSLQSLHQMGPKFCLYILCGVNELKAAWNCLRLTEIASAQRAARVAFEFVSIASLVVTPTAITKHITISSEQRKRLDDANWDFWYLFNCGKLADGSSTKPPEQSTVAAALFLKLMEHVVKPRPAVVEALRWYRERVHHPLAHGSTETWSQQLHGCDGQSMGTGFRNDRKHFYLECADGLTHVTELLDESLNCLGTMLSAEV